MSQDQSSSFRDKISILSLFALISLCFLAFSLGAAYVHYYPKENIFSNAVKAFRALRFVYLSNSVSAEFKTEPRVKQTGVTVNLTNQADNGYTLYSSSDTPTVNLIDMKGTPVHVWDLNKSNILVDVANVTVNDAHLFPNGDLIAVVTSEFNSPWGLGVVKVDLNSKLQWSYYGSKAHHQFSIGDDGQIYVLTHRYNNTPSEWITHLFGFPSLEDHVTVLDNQGKEIKSFSIFDAFEKSEYKAFIENLKIWGRWDTGNYEGDNTHANTIKYITKEVAKNVPFLKPGEVLVTLRNIDTIAAIDVNQGVVTWAITGPWHQQHEALFLENSNILLFDNKSQWPLSRVIEYDPKTLQIVWQYSGSEGKPLQSMWFGKAQVLRNRDLLITETGGGRLLEITLAGEIVWEFSNPERVEGTSQTWMIPFGYRYYKNQISFLNTEEVAK